MKKINFKKFGLPIALVIVIVLSSVVAVWTMNQTDAKKLKENGEASTTESTTLADGEEPVTEVYTEIVEVVETSEKDNGEIVTVKSTEIETKVKVVNATEKKEDKTTEKVTEEKSTSAKEEKTTNVQVDAPVADTTKKVVHTTQASKPVVTTKPVETTKKPAVTKPAKPTTTKAPKDEYYPALTAADMKTLEAYCKQYVESKGYTYDSSLNWDNAGYGCTTGLNDNLSIYGNKYKVNNGISPVERFKIAIREDVDYYIDVFGDREWLSMVFLYERNGNSWRIAVGYMA